MTGIRRILKWTALGGALAGAAATLALSLAYVWLQSESGRTWLAAAAGRALSTPGRMEVTLGGLEGRFPNALRLKELSLADAAGPWLSARNLRLDWRPWSLLDEVFEAELLAVESLRIARLPEAAAAETAAPEAFHLPKLPLRIRIGRLEVPDLGLGETVLGLPARLRIAGGAEARQDGSLEARLAIDRRDGGEGRLRLDASYRPADDRLALDLDLAEAPGGLVARLLDIPGLPAIAATLAGAGPRDDWRGAVNLQLADLAAIEAEVALKRGEALDFTLKGSAANDAAAPLLPWQILDGPLAFDIAGSWRDDGRLTIAGANLRGGEMALDLDGELDTATMALRARARTTLPDSASFADWLPGISGTGIRATLTAEGPLAQPKLALSAGIDRLSTPDLAADDVNLTAAFAPDRPLGGDSADGDFTLSGTAARLAGAALADLEPLIGRPLAWDAEGRLADAGRTIEARRLTLEGDGLHVSAPGRISLDDGRAELDLEASLDDIGRLEALSGLALHGRAKLTGPLALSQDWSVMDGDLSSEINGFSIDLPVIQDLFAGAVSLSSGLHLDRDGLSLERLSAVSDRARLSGAAAFDAGFEALTADYDLALDEAAVLAEALGVALSGPARLQGQAAGPIDDPRVTGRLALARLGHAGLRLSRLRGRYEVADPAGAPEGRASLTAETPFGAASLTGRFAVGPEAVRLSALEGESQGARLSGAASLPLDGGPARANLLLTSERLRPWLAAAGLDGDGRLTGEVRLSAQGTRQAAAAEFRVSALSLAPPGGGPPLTIAEVSGRAGSEDLRADLAGDVRIAATDLRRGALRLERLTAEAAGGRAGAEVTLATAGRLEVPLELTAAAAVAAQGDVWTLALHRLDGRLADEAFGLDRPTRLVYGPGRIELAESALRYGPGRLSLALRQDDRGIAARLEAADFPARLLGAVLPAPLAGTLAARAEITGSLAAPRGQITLGARGLRMRELKDAPPVDLSLDGDWRDGRLVLAGRMTGPDYPPARLSLDLPLHWDPEAASLSVPERAPLSAALAWQGEVARLWDLAGFAQHELSGLGEIDVRVTGTLQQQSYGGEIGLSGGRYENLETGTLLEDLALRVALAGTDATLTELSADDGKDGKLSAGGSGKLSWADGFPFSLEARFENLLLVRRDEVTGTADGRLRLDGRLERGELSGSVTTRTVELRIPDRLPREIADLDVIEVVSARDAPTVAGDSPGGAAGWPLALALEVDLPRQVFLRGRGIDSEWSGSFTVAGTAAEPAFTGALTVVRGQVALAGKAFKLERGRIYFPEGAQSDPLVDILAVRETSELRAEVRITGEAGNPTLELASVPELPEDEVVSQVLFGQSASQLNAVQAAQLAAAVAQMSGSGDPAGNVLEKLRTVLGIDVLRFDTTGEPGSEAPAASAGTYVTDEVYLGVTQGADAESGSVNVGVELTPNIAVESDVTQTGDGNVGIKFKWDY